MWPLPLSNLLRPIQLTDKTFIREWERKTSWSGLTLHTQQHTFVNQDQSFSLTAWKRQTLWQTTIICLNANLLAQTLRWTLLQSFVCTAHVSHIPNAGLFTLTARHKHLSLHSGEETCLFSIENKKRSLHAEHCDHVLSLLSLPRQPLQRLSPEKISDVPLFYSVRRVFSNFSAHTASRTLPCRSIPKSGKRRSCAVFLYYVVSPGVHRAHWSSCFHLWSKEGSLDNCLYLSYLRAPKEPHSSLCIPACNLMAKLQMLSVQLNLCMTLPHSPLSLFCSGSPNYLYLGITDADRVIMMNSNGVGLQLGVLQPQMATAADDGLHSPQGIWTFGYVGNF